MTFIANARMYSVAPEAEAAWKALIAHVGDEAGVPLSYLPYPAPQPLERLWALPDLGCVFMCGFPLALGMADVEPLAAPVPSLPWAEGRPVYRSDFIVRADSPFRTLEDTFGHRFGWTAAHSHSGFNAPRRHLSQMRTPGRQRLFSEVTGDLVTARAVLDAVRAGSIDVGPLDAFWHALAARHRPELVADIRVVASTALAPIPALVASRSLSARDRAALRRALAGAAGRPWFAAPARELLVAGFSPLAREDYAPLLAWQEQARAAGYAAIA